MALALAHGPHGHCDPDGHQGPQPPGVGVARGVVPQAPAPAPGVQVVVAEGAPLDARRQLLLLLCDGREVAGARAGAAEPRAQGGALPHHLLLLALGESPLGPCGRLVAKGLGVVLVLQQRRAEAMQSATLKTTSMMERQREREARGGEGFPPRRAQPSFRKGRGGGREGGGAHRVCAGAALLEEAPGAGPHLLHKAPHAMADREAREALGDLHALAMQEDCLARDLSVAARGRDCANKGQQSKGALSRCMCV